MRKVLKVLGIMTVMLLVYFTRRTGTHLSADTDCFNKLSDVDCLVNSLLTRGTTAAISDLIGAPLLTGISPGSTVVVTVFDATYAPLVGPFVKMCGKQGLPQVLALALTKEALSAADVPRSSLAYSSVFEEYVKKKKREDRWRAIGRMKTFLAAAVGVAGFSPFILELDVVVLPQTLSLPNTIKAQQLNKPFDVATMYCPEPHGFATPTNRINLGLQYYNPAQAHVWTPFLVNITLLGFAKSSWDQEEYNTYYLCRKSGECPGPPLKLKELTICFDHPLYANEDGIGVFGRLVHQLGSVHAAAAASTKVAMHVIGFPGMRTLDWLRCALIYDLEDVGSKSTGYIMLIAPVLQKDAPATKAANTMIDRLAGQFRRIPIMSTISCSPAETCSALDVCYFVNKVNGRPAAVLNGYLYGTKDPPRRALVVGLADLMKRKADDADLASAELILVNVEHLPRLTISLTYENECNVSAHACSVSLDRATRALLINPPKDEPAEAVKKWGTTIQGFLARP